MATNFYQRGLRLPSGRPNPYQRQPQNPWTGTGTVEQAYGGLDYEAQQGWGRSLSQEQKNAIAQNAQAKGYQGGNVTGDQYNEAKKYMESLLGDRLPQEPVQQTPVLGNDQAIAQWQQQQRAVGVPQSFRGANPYASQQQALMSRILAAPQTMGQQQQDQLNETQKESALRMQQQMQAQGQQGQVQRGFGGGGPQTQALNDQARQQTMQAILSGRRDTALRAAGQNRQDELQALKASQDLSQQEFQNNMGLYGMGLQQINQNRGANLQDFLGLHGADMDMLRYESANDQFNKTYGLDFLRYLQNGDQFNRSFGEGQRQFNGQMGFNWSQLQGNQMQNFLNTLLGIY